MALSVGTRLGPYEVLSAIGAGGMGEVYRARDTKLNRDVAIKVLPESFAHDHERLARFQREAQALAALNHPNIAAIYGLEDGAIVMELVSGSTLAEMLAKAGRPARLGLPDALAIARQVADALEAAHEAGIVHRDLKPANVKVRDDGTVKVLDFGLAKALDPPSPEATAGKPGYAMNSPTMTSPAMTGLGMILGTAAYMAPEQAAGKPVDKRADIWAFGVVLWEMLTGRVLFDGETVSHTLADVLRAPIDFAALPAATPAPIHELVTRCLDRDVKTRLRDIGEARVVIQKCLANPSALATTSSSERVRRPRFERASWVLAGMAVVAAAALAFIHFGEPPPKEAVVRSSVLPPDEASGFALDANIGGTAISPDGSLLVFAATVKGRPVLWVRQLDSLSARMLPGTEDAGRPFWSPDSRNIGFYSHGKLRRIGVAGGAPREICDLALPRGASWNADDVIVLSLGRPGVIARVSASGGGTPVPITALKEREQDHYWPHFLPDGKHFLFGVRIRQDQGVTTAVRVASLDDPPGGGGTSLVESAYGGVFAPNPADARRSHLLFLQGASLMAQMFDPIGLKLSGEAEPIASDVGGTESNAYVDLSASQTGVLAHGNSTQPPLRVTVLDSRGKPEVTTEVAASPRLSAKGRWVVAARFSRVGGRIASGPGPGGRADIILIDLTQPNNEPRVVTLSGSNRAPIWSPDGNEVVYSVFGQGLFRTRVDGGGAPQSLLTTDPNATSLDWSVDGKFLLYGAPTADSRLIDLRAVPMEAPAAGKPFTYLQGLPGVSVTARFSPNRTGARWVAYGSRDLPKSRVFVQKFPDADGPRLVSDDGDLPVWDPNGKALFFRRGRTLMSVAVRMTQESIAFDPPKHVLDIPGQVQTGTTGIYDVGPDGRFLFALAEEDSGRIGNSITLVQNWQAGLKR